MAAIANRALLSLSFRSSRAVATRGLSLEPKVKSWSAPTMCRSLATGSDPSSSPHTPIKPEPTSKIQYSRGPSTPHGPRMMLFEDYRKLKKSLKWRARLAGIPMGFAGVVFSSFINIQLNPTMLTATTEEEIETILGLDPIAFSVLCGAGSGIVAFIFGGAFFNTFWKVMFPTKARQLQERDENYLSRLQVHRFSELSTYNDDFYGDKVITLSDYRQWIRQQQKKREAVQKQSVETVQSESPTATSSS